MIIHRQCPMCGKGQTKEVDMDAYNVWRSGTLIQKAFPNLPVVEREFIMTGYCEKCQAIVFAPPPDEV